MVWLLNLYSVGASNIYRGIHYGTGPERQVSGKQLDVELAATVMAVYSANGCLEEPDESFVL